MPANAETSRPLRKPRRSTGARLSPAHQFAATALLHAGLSPNAVADKLAIDNETVKAFRDRNLISNADLQAIEKETAGRLILNRALVMNKITEELEKPQKLNVLATTFKCLEIPKESDNARDSQVKTLQAYDVTYKQIDPVASPDKNDETSQTRMDTGDRTPFIDHVDVG